MPLVTGEHHWPRGYRHARVAMLAWLLLAGCEAESIGPVLPPAAAATSGGASPENAVMAAATSTADPVLTVAPQAPPQRVQLSAGVSLAQTLPSGTGMLFSVDYRLLEDGAESDTGFLLVIRNSAGVEHFESVALQSAGTLTVVIPDWKPEQGPFQTWVAAANGITHARVSEIEVLRSP